MNLKNCPSCKTKGSIRQIIWGMPDEEPDPNKYVIGGCLVSDNDPTHECIKCGWQRFKPSNNYDDLPEAFIESLKKSTTEKADIEFTFRK